MALQAGGQYGAMLNALDPNASLDTPPTLVELRNAYRNIRGSGMELRFKLAQMAASFDVNDIAAVWGRDPRPDVHRLLYDPKGRLKATVPDRRALVHGMPAQEAYIVEWAPRRKVPAVRLTLTNPSSYGNVPNTMHPARVDGPHTYPLPRAVEASVYYVTTPNGNYFVNVGNALPVEQDGNVV